MHQSFSVRKNNSACLHILQQCLKTYLIQSYIHTVGVLALLCSFLKVLVFLGFTQDLDKSIWVIGSTRNLRRSDVKTVSLSNLAETETVNIGKQDTVHQLYRVKTINAR